MQYDYYDDDGDSFDDWDRDLDPNPDCRDSRDDDGD